MARLSRRALLRAAGATAAGTLAGCSVPFLGGGRSGWSVVGATGARTFHLPEATIPANRPRIQWQAPIDAPVAQSLLATDSLAIAGTPVGVIAVELSDGSTAWTYPFASTGGGTDMVVAGDTLVVRRFFPGSDRDVRRVGLSLPDGDVRYERSGTYRGSPLWVPAAGDLFGLSDSGTIRQFDAETGEWGDPLVETGGEVWGTVTDGTRLYLPIDRDGEWTVEAVSLDSGELTWSRPLPWGTTVSMVATDDRLVFTDVPDVDGRPGALGLEPSTGDVAWTFDWGADPPTPWRAVANEETVYLLGRRRDGPYRLAAVDLAGGDVDWAVDTDLQLPFAVTADRLVGSTVTQQFPAPGLVALDASGDVDWRLEPGDGVFPGIAIDRGVLSFVEEATGPTLALLA